MNGYPYPPRPFQGSDAGPMMMDMAGGGMDGYDMVEGQSLDSIVTQNDKDNRRLSMPVYARRQQMNMGNPDPPRLGVMGFGDPNDTSMDGYQFDMSSAAMDSMMRSNTTFPRTAGATQNNRNAPYSAMTAPSSAYASPMHQKSSLDMDMSSYANGMLDMDDSLNMMPTNMNMYPGTQFNAPMLHSPVNQDFCGPRSNPSQENNAPSMQSLDQFKRPSMSITPEAKSARSSFLGRSESQDQQSMRSNSRPESDQRSSIDVPTRMSLSSLRNQQPATQDPTQDLAQDLPKDILNKQLQHGKTPWSPPEAAFPPTKHHDPYDKTQFKNVYSSTGFDMLGVLMRVASRPDPEIDIGSVDLSCAFVVCDAELDDIPIVYCSDNFERLTGYTRHMILGRNCRFLQAPDGKVESGVKRNYVDDDSVYYLKSIIRSRSEAQISLINYRRGGQPFMNLLTVIPIAWEPGGKTKFFVGFQVDLVEQPGAMTNKNADGSFRVNYQRGTSMPSYVYSEHHRPQHSDRGQTISKDEVSNVLAAYSGSGDSEMTRRVWDKVLLENSDDVVHVLSLKGLFLYLSPASNRILEYDPSELVGTALSSVCHPSDIVPVTRELKETTSGASVNVVFRIRRKKSGYMWFEGHGSLHTEQGKGRKCIILVGRERPVYTLSKAIVRESGGVGDNELWTKMSTSGMFLFVSSNVRQLLDKQPEDLVGTSIQSLMRQDSKINFGRILELARGGRKGEVKHEMINKRGQVLQAFTTIYPGDATEGQKPTFVVGQTRLLKYSRNNNAGRPSIYTNAHKDRDTHGSVHTQYTVGSPAGSSTPKASGDNPLFVTTEESPATYAGHNGLRIGHQDQSLASDDNVFDELKTTRSTSWQYELRQMEKRNRYLAEEVQSLLAAKKKRKRRKGAGQMQKDCANCHTRTTPEWRRGPSGNRDLCNSCGLRWAKQQGRVSPRTSSVASDKSKKSPSPRHQQSYQTHQNILPNSIPKTGQQSSIPSTLAPPCKRPPQEGSISEPHAAKQARTEIAFSQGFVPPPMIDEGSEPDSVT
ncbi:white collar-1 transcript variant 2 [Clathrospora elynae]|uniref:White collar-1 transcript variant 2 n=1 Tax=Clathrospora elynae TaxID=706981 RepID=A0A6A5T1E7_9PLEO|nr:white collar-1 transcript variant 2 [Clathrospora elynae]